MLTTQQLTRRQATAIAKAQALGLPAQVEGGRHAGYLVPSTSQPGRSRFVRPDGRCDCLASVAANTPCVHAAAAWIARNGLESFRVTLRAPDTTPTPERPESTPERPEHTAVPAARARYEREEMLARTEIEHGAQALPSAFANWDR